MKSTISILLTVCFFALIALIVINGALTTEETLKEGEFSIGVIKKHFHSYKRGDKVRLVFLVDP